MWYRFVLAAMRNDAGRYVCRFGSIGGNSMFNASRCECACVCVATERAHLTHTDCVLAIVKSREVELKVKKKRSINRKIFAFDFGGFFR